MVTVTVNTARGGFCATCPADLADPARAMLAEFDLRGRAKQRGAEEYILVEPASPWCWIVVRRAGDKWVADEPAPEGTRSTELVRWFPHECRMRVLMERVGDAAFHVPQYSAGVEWDAASETKDHVYMVRPDRLLEYSHAGWFITPERLTTYAEVEARGPWKWVSLEKLLDHRPGMLQVLGLPRGFSAEYGGNQLLRVWDGQGRLVLEDA